MTSIVLIPAVLRGAIHSRASSIEPASHQIERGLVSPIPNSSCDRRRWAIALGDQRRHGGQSKAATSEASHQIEVTQQTFYRWRAEYRVLRIYKARRIKKFEAENTRLKRAVADLTLDNQVLKEAAAGNF